MSAPRNVTPSAPPVPSPADAARVNGPTGTVPTPVAPPAPPADRRATRLLTVLAVLAVLLVATAVLLGVAWGAQRHSGPRSNQAFTDGGATAALVGEVTNAVIAVYSYDYTTLPANEAAAKAVVTGRYASEIDRLFAPLKQVAVAQQASMRATVPAAAVSLLRGDRARLLMMVDQAGVHGTDKQPTGASARLMIDAQRIEGHWKIAEVTPE
jgi:Mce-associated membrane protein